MKRWLAGFGLFVGLIHVGAAQDFAVSDLINPGQAGERRDSSWVVAASPNYVLVLVHRGPVASGQFRLYHRSGELQTILPAHTNRGVGVDDQGNIYALLASPSLRLVKFDRTGRELASVLTAKLPIQPEEIQVHPKGAVFLRRWDFRQTHAIQFAILDSDLRPRLWRRGIFDPFAYFTEDYVVYRSRAGGVNFVSTRDFTRTGVNLPIGSIDLYRGQSLGNLPGNRLSYTYEIANIRPGVSRLAQFEVSPNGARYLGRFDVPMMTRALAPQGGVVLLDPVTLTLSRVSIDGTRRINEVDRDQLWRDIPGGFMHMFVSGEERRLGFSADGNQEFLLPKLRKRGEWHRSLDGTYWRVADGAVHAVTAQGATQFPLKDLVAPVRVTGAGRLRNGSVIVAFDYQVVHPRSGFSVFGPDFKRRRTFRFADETRVFPVGDRIAVFSRNDDSPWTTLRLLTQDGETVFTHRFEAPSLGGLSSTDSGPLFSDFSQGSARGVYQLFESGHMQKWAGRAPGTFIHRLADGRFLSALDGWATLYYAEGGPSHSSWLGDIVRVTDRNGMVWIDARATGDEIVGIVLPGATSVLHFHDPKPTYLLHDQCYAILEDFPRSALVRQPLTSTLQGSNNWTTLKTFTGEGIGWDDFHRLLTFDNVPDAPGQFRLTRIALDARPDQSVIRYAGNEVYEPRLWDLGRGQFLFSGIKRNANVNNWAEWPEVMAFVTSR